MNKIEKLCLFFILTPILLFTPPLFNFSGAYVINIQTASASSSVPVVLKAIAQCESENKQYGPDGLVLKGKINPRDWGKYQINLDAHGDEARKLGLDLANEKDNETFAEWLYAKEGSQPWYLSQSCWEKILRKDGLQANN